METGVISKLYDVWYGMETGVCRASELSTMFDRLITVKGC